VASKDLYPGSADAGEIAEVPRSWTRLHSMYWLFNI